MSLDFAILGFLRYSPLTGYDLKKTFDRSVRHFWPADQSQIYRTLSRLVDRGLATMEWIPQKDRPGRKVYNITDQGSRSLEEWLSAPLPPQEDRAQFLVQVFFAACIKDEDILPLFEQKAEWLRGLLAEYRKIGREQPKEKDNWPPRDKFFWLLPLEYGILNAETALGWAESVIERLKRQDYTFQTYHNKKERKS